MLLGKPDNFDPENPEPGMYLDMPEAVYRGAKAWNWSVLSEGVPPNGTMSKVKDAWDNPADEEDTPDKLEGRCFDIVHLQAASAADQIAVPPPTYPSEKSSGRGKDKTTEIIDKPWNNNAKHCQAWRAKQREAGKEILRAKDLNRLKAMAESLNQIKGVRELIDGAFIQPSIFWKDTQTGLMCKARLDVYKNGIIGDDKKVAKSAAWEAFSGHVRAYKINCQLAMYLDGVQALFKLSKCQPPKLWYVRLMVVEDHAPFDAAVYDFYDREGAGSRAWLIDGRIKWHRVLQQVAYCLKKGIWPGHNADNPQGITEVEELEPPDWVVPKLETTL